MNDREYIIKLNNAQDIRELSSVLNSFSNIDFDIVSGRYFIDGKSIMGLFTLDISKPFVLTANSYSEIERLELEKALEKFLKK